MPCAAVPTPSMPRGRPTWPTRCGWRLSRPRCGRGWRAPGCARTGWRNEKGSVQQKIAELIPRTDHRCDMLPTVKATCKELRAVLDRVEAVAPAANDMQVARILLKLDTARSVLDRLVRPVED